MLKIIFGIAILWIGLSVIISMGIYGLFLLLFGLAIYKPSFWINLCKLIFELATKLLFVIGAIVFFIPMLIITLLKGDNNKK